MSKIKILTELFLSMLKIGAFTFGGGYAMITLLENEFVAVKGWLGGDEFADLVTIAESTPGPIAINCSTYIGYKRMGVAGAVVSTLGMCIPSFLIIYLISLFFDTFLSLSAIASAFKGIRACVIFLILSAGIKMLKKIKKTPFTISVILIFFAVFVTLSLLSTRISSIFYIIVSAALGLFIYAIGRIRNSFKTGEGEK